MTSTSTSDEPAGELQVRSTASASRYEWGDGCEGWRLVADDDLSVIEERMPPGTAETWHVHSRSKQLFYLLAGEVEVRTDAGSAALRAGESVTVGPGVPHCVANTASDAARFLVVSAPTTLLDRQAVSPPRRWEAADVPEAGPRLDPGLGGTTD